MVPGKQQLQRFLIAPVKVVQQVLIGWHDALPPKNCGQTSGLSPLQIRRTRPPAFIAGQKKVVPTRNYCIRPRGLSDSLTIHRAPSNNPTEEKWRSQSLALAFQRLIGY